MIRRSAVLALVCSTLCFDAVWVAAEETANRETIEEITVTATRREQGVYDVPASLSVFSQDSVVERNIDDLIDVGKFVPNLNVTAFSAGHAASAHPFIRGIGLQDHLITTEPGVGVYVDGVYLGRQVGQHWHLANVERVEVLRGPQGTLYGRNSIGGAINIVTASPGSNPGATLSTRLGSRDRADATVHVDRNLSDAWAFTATGGFKSRGGVGEFVNLPATNVQVGEVREVSGRIALAGQLAPNLTLDLAIDMNDGENGLLPYTTLIDELPFGAVFGAGYRNSDVAANGYDNRTGQINQVQTTNSANGIAATLEWFLTDQLSAKLIASKRSSEYQAGLDDDSFFDDFLSFPEVGEADQTAFETQLTGDFGDWDFVAGTHTFSEDGSNIQDPTTFLGFKGHFMLSQEVDSQAVFANVGRSLNERWRVSVGWRTTRDDKQAETNVGTGLVKARRDWAETNLDLTARYAANDQMSVYGSIQSGYQSGQFPARPYCLFADLDCFVASDNVTASNYEFGLKGQPRPNFETSAAVFHTRYADLPYQVSSTTDAGFNTVNLVVTQKTSGVEWESTLLLSSAMRVQWAIGYLDVDVDRMQGVQAVAPLTPKLTFSVGADYLRDLVNGGEFKARIDFSWRDKVWGEPSADLGRMTRMESRGLANVYLGFTVPSDRWTLAFYGRNVTDGRYDMARVNTGDYLLRILSNDAREFGLRLNRSFR